MAGVKANPQDAAAAWVSGMQQAGAKYKAGIAAVKVAPGQLAAQSADRWATNVQNAKSKFAANSAKVTLTAWQEAASSKGADRLGTGAVAAQSKMATFQAKFLPALANVVNGLPQRGTFEQNMQRQLAYATALHNAAGSF